MFLAGDAVVVASTAVVPGKSPGVVIFFWVVVSPSVVMAAVVGTSVGPVVRSVAVLPTGHRKVSQNDSRLYRNNFVN